MAVGVGLTQRGALLTIFGAFYGTSADSAPVWTFVCEENTVNRDTLVYGWR